MTLVPVLQGTADGPFLLAWELNIPLIALILAAGWGYRFALRRARERGYHAHPRWYTASFYAGLTTLAIALLGPLDVYSDQLFSLHMAQHVMLIQATVPLLLLGRPVLLLLKALPPSRRGAILRPIVRLFKTFPSLHSLAPLVAAIIFNITIVVWHFPEMYGAALKNDFVHSVMHFSFFGAGLLFWWGIIAPVPRKQRSRTIWVLISIVITMIVGKLLGGILTLSTDAVYSYYDSVERPWGVTVMVDQQLAGLVMILGGGLYFGIVLFVLIARWLLRNEEQQRRREGARRRVAAPAVRSADVMAED